MTLRAIGPVAAAGDRARQRARQPGHPDTEEYGGQDPPEVDVRAARFGDEDADGNREERNSHDERGDVELMPVQWDLPR